MFRILGSFQPGGPRPSHECGFLCCRMMTPGVGEPTWIALVATRPRKVAMHKRIKILQSCFRDPGLIGSGVRFCLVLVAGLDATASLALAQVQPAVARPRTVAAAAPPGTNGLNGSAANGEAAVSGPVTNFVSIQPPRPQPPIPIPPLPPPGATPADAIPRVIPLEPIGGANDPRTTAPQPKVIRLGTDAGGMVPNRPPLTSETKTRQEVAAEMSNLIEVVKARKRKSVWSKVKAGSFKVARPHADCGCKSGNR